MLVMQRIVESRRKKVVGEPCEVFPHSWFEVAEDGNHDMVVVLRHSHKETGSNGSTSPKSQASFPDPTSRPPDRGFDCCRSWLCGILVLVLYAVSSGGG